MLSKLFTMEKNEYISEIKSIIDKWGGVTTSELKLDSSPVYNKFGKDSFSLVERFNRDDVTILSYVHENEVDEFNVDYEDLNEDLLHDIHYIIEQYDIGMEKTFDNIRDEDF